MDGDFSGITHHFLAEVERFEPFIEKYGLALIIAAVAVEGFGIPVPGQTLLIVGAVMATRGNFNITLLLVSAWLAAVGGNVTGYFIGRRGGEKLLKHLPVNPARLGHMESLCARYGYLLVLVSRFIDGLRQTANILVGALRMRFVLFLVMSSAGSLLWVGFWGLGAYYLGQNFQAIALWLKQLSPYSWAATVLLIVVLCIYLIHWRRAHKPGQQKG
jgi:membrane protein DedA with SNARE-associated domain